MINIKKLGKNVDLTEGTPWKKMILFALPIILTSILAHIFSIIDSIIIGQFAPDQYAGVGNVGSVTFSFSQFYVGCVLGFSVISSQFFGKKDLFKLKKSFSNSLVLGAAIGLLVTIIGFITAKPMLSLINIKNTVGNETTYKAAYLYLLTIICGYFFQSIDTTIANQLRSIGDSKTPMIVSFITQGVNFVLTFIFVYFLKNPNLKVVGAGMASVFAMILNAIILFIYTQRKYNFFKIRISDLKIDWNIAKRQLKNGLPIAFQYSILGLGIIALAGSIVSFDQGVYLPGHSLLDPIPIQATYAQNARSCGSKVSQYLGIIHYALTSSILSFIGQCEGAKDFDRQRKGLKQMSIVLLIVYAFSVVIGLILSIDGAYLYIFLNKSSIYDRTKWYGSTFLSIYMITSILQITLLLFRNALQGKNKPMLPFIGGIAELAGRLFVCLVLRYWICPDNPNSDLAFIIITLADAVAWLVDAIVMLPGVIKYFSKKNDIKAAKEIDL